MAVHPQIQPILDMMSQAGMLAIETQEPAAVRAMMDLPMGAETEAVAKVEERSIAGPAGSLALRIYTPVGSGPHRLVVFFHGGGFVVGTLDTHDALARALANTAGAVVVSVDYRLAPEHPFPAAPEDCYAATEWVANHAGELGARAETLAVAGDSAGGALAAGVCQMSADRQGPSIAYQILLYPVTDCNFETGSYRDNAEGYFLTRAMMEWFWGHYLAAPADADRPYCAPLRRGDLTGLPPASVVTAQYDPLRDEGEAYGVRLAEAGVEVRSHRWDGMIHGFVSFLDGVDSARQALAQAADEYRQAVDSRQP